MSRRWGAIAVVAAAVALLATQSASAARVYAGQPAGQSGFQLVLTTSDNGKKVRGLTFHFDVSCRTDFRTVDFGSSTLVDDLPDRFRYGRHYLVAKVSGTKLSGTLVGADAFDTTEEWMHAKLTGTLSEGKASGRVSVRFADIDTTTSLPVARCSRTISWKALRDPGVVYGGRTSQDEPVVIELTPDRKRVSHAHLSWFAPCQASDIWWTERHDEFDLQPLKLSGSGAFNRTYRWNMGEGEGIVERFSGRVTKTKAAGAFRADVTLGGATPTTCTSGAVSWRAATG